MMFAIVAALVALVCWGVGDFLLQRSIRHIGVVEMVFVLGIIGGLVLFPFVISDIGTLFSVEGFSMTLLLAGVIMYVNAVVLFRAYDQGKLAAVEPISGLELPIALGLAVIFLGEHLTWLQAFAIAGVFVGLLFTVTREWKHLHLHRRLFEKGVLLALMASIAGALINIFIGISAKSISPVSVTWFVFVLGSVISLPYLAFYGRLGVLAKKVRTFAPLVIFACLVDCAAWLGYAYASSDIEISLAVALSEGYIALAALLGVLFNHEKIKRHQFAGIALTTVSVIWLALLTQGNA